MKVFLIELSLVWISSMNSTCWIHNSLCVYLADMHFEMTFHQVNFNAFLVMLLLRNDFPSSEFQCLSSDVVATTGGLPLALKVIGSLLFGERDRKVWEETKKMLRSTPNEEVQKMLKISYDKLGPKAQQIFLDIACFFNGEETTYPIYFWDDSDFFPRSQIRLLVSRCLLKIEGDRFKMHDQLRDLGRAIIRPEDYNNPKNRCRLWDSKEALSVLERHEGSEKIQAIRVSSPLDFEYEKKQFEKLPNLRMLHVEDGGFWGDYQNSFAELRWLRWRNSVTLGFTGFHLEKLVILELWNISISGDWRGWSLMKMLKVLHITSGYHFWNFPDLSRCTNLEILSLQFCWGFKRVHPSIGGMNTLVSLNLSGCRSLKELPTEGSSQELKELVMDGTAIGEIPEWIVFLKKLETLSAQGCQQLARIPKVGNLCSLKVLVIDDTAIGEIPEWIFSLKKLETLSARGCGQLARIPEIGNLPSLEVLRLKETSISKLPEMFYNLSSLQVLDVQRCNQLQFIPNLPSSLTSLLLTCQSITLPNLFELVNLKELELIGCTRLEVIPDFPSRLLRLVIDGCIKLKKLPNLSLLKQLTALELNFCPKLEEITGLEWLTSLTRLNAIGCPKLPRLGGLEGLEGLTFYRDDFRPYRGR